MTGQSHPEHSDSGEPEVRAKVEQIERWHEDAEQSDSRWIEGRFLDGQLDLLLTRGVDPGPGYAVALWDQRIWRNGEYVGDAKRLSYDRDALGWWVEYVTWHGSPLDMGAGCRP